MFIFWVNLNIMWNCGCRVILPRIPCMPLGPSSPSPVAPRSPLSPRGPINTHRVSVLSFLMIFFYSVIYSHQSGQVALRRPVVPEGPSFLGHPGVPAVPGRLWFSQQS